MVEIEKLRKELKENIGFTDEEIAEFDRQRHENRQKIIRMHNEQMVQLTPESIAEIRKSLEEFRAKAKNIDSDFDDDKAKYEALAEKYGIGKSTITFETDETILAQADDILDKLGLDMDTAINLFLEEVVRTKGIPFELDNIKGE